jgi:hypothetical protein
MGKGLWHGSSISDYFLPEAWGLVCCVSFVGVVSWLLVERSAGLNSVVLIGGAALVFEVLGMSVGVGTFVSMHGRASVQAFMHGPVFAAQSLVIFFIFIDPCAGRQSLSLPLPKKVTKESGWGVSGVRT